ncbi:uncharacterized protein LOC141914527 [Tubulanus polymorphus]|uniref:uncharacterized protein LOC141914527 n=1 Tax=Tubulanus polymorphus TaxID=672921 RepID=UPI003DA5AE35
MRDAILTRVKTSGAKCAVMYKRLLTPQQIYTIVYDIGTDNEQTMTRDESRETTNYNEYRDFIFSDSRVIEYEKEEKIVVEKRQSKVATRKSVSADSDVEMCEVAKKPAAGEIENSDEFEQVDGETQMETEESDESTKSEKAEQDGSADGEKDIETDMKKEVEEDLTISSSSEASQADNNPEKTKSATTKAFANAAAAMRKRNASSSSSSSSSSEEEDN